LLSVAWMTVGCYLLNSFFDGSAERTRFQLINGCIWIALSAIFIARARLFAKAPFDRLHPLRGDAAQDALHLPKTVMHSVIACVHTRSGGTLSILVI